MYMLVKGMVLTGASVAVAMSSPSKTPSATPARADSTTFVVQNDRPVRVTVYLEQGEFDRRLGTVPADSTATLRVPEAAVRADAGVQVYVHPEGEFDLASQDLRIKPGGNIGVIVPSAADLAPPPPETMADPDPMNPATSVTVRNDGKEDVVVFAQKGDFDSRLGSVPARQVATLRIPDWLTDRDGVQLLVHPAQGWDFTSQERSIRKGEHLGIIVPER